MVCSLRSSNAGRSEVCMAKSSSLEILPSILYLKELPLPHLLSPPSEPQPAPSVCNSCQEQMQPSSHATALCETCQEQTSVAATPIRKHTENTCSTAKSPSSNTGTTSTTTTPKRQKFPPLATGPPENSHPNTSNSQVIVLVEDKQDLHHVPPTFATQNPPDIYTIVESKPKTLEDRELGWCRYCGTTNGVNWRPGPWGKRTLCNRHGCDFKGYGFAAHKPKLDLSAFYDETLEHRKIPIIKEFCMHCQSKVSLETKPLRMCHGCPRSYHPQCFIEALKESGGSEEQQKHSHEWFPGRPWFCSDKCVSQYNECRVEIELPKKGLPYSLGSKSSSPGHSPKPMIKSHSGSGSTRTHRKHSSSTGSSRDSFASRHCDGNFFYDSELIARLTRNSIGNSNALLASCNGGHNSSISIEIPKWAPYSLEGCTTLQASEAEIEAMEGGSVLEEEQTNDDIYIARHSAYEQLEKGNKLMFNPRIDSV